MIIMWQICPSDSTMTLFLSQNLELDLLKQRLLALVSPSHEKSCLALLSWWFLNNKVKRDFSSFSFIARSAILVRRRQWQPTPVFLPGKSHGQRSLVGYSPWDGKESDTPRRLSMPAVHMYVSSTSSTPKVLETDNAFPSLYFREPSPYWLKQV